MNKVIAIPMLLLAFGLVAAPGVHAANHENTTDIPDEEDVTYDVSEDDAVQMALDQLSDREWTVESVEQDDGVYEIEFTAEGVDGEAEVSIDASNAEILELEEELEEETEESEEAENETEREEEQEQETEESERDENETTEQVSTLEEARERIAELREQVQELREEVRELRSDEEEREALPDEASDRAREARERRGPPEGVPGQRGEASAEVEVEQEDNETEVEVEAERRGPPANRGPSEQARENVNGTPGNNSNRPGFVNQMLRAMFG